MTQTYKLVSVTQPFGALAPLLHRSAVDDDSRCSCRSEQLDHSLHVDLALALAKADLDGQRELRLGGDAVHQLGQRPWLAQQDGAQASPRRLCTSKEKRAV